jgi:aryl-alcohol dehydrogenase-like predicted oxidoreductase
MRRAHAVHPVAAMQTEYSLWSRNPEIAVLATCAELGCAFVAFSPVARGVFANGVRDPDALVASDLRRSQPRFNAENWPHNLQLVDRFNTLAASLDITPAQLALAWVLSRGEHVIAIPGTASVAHLEENVRARDIELSGETIDRLDSLINRHTVAGPRYSAAMQRAIETEEFA